MIESATEIGLYDRPRIVQPNQDQQQPQKLKIHFETDHSNTGLVTNPHALWKLVKVNTFMELSHEEQVTVLNLLTVTLQKCANNCHILAEVHHTALKMNQTTISHLKRGSLPNLAE